MSICPPLMYSALVPKGTSVYSEPTVNHHGLGTWVQAALDDLIHGDTDYVVWTFTGHRTQGTHTSAHFSNTLAGTWGAGCRKGATSAAVFSGCLLMLSVAELEKTLIVIRATVADIE